MNLQVTLVGGLVLLALLSCEPESSQPILDELPHVSVLRRGNGDDPATLDPALAEDVHTFNVLVDIYEGLVAESADGTLIPGVATSWEIEAGGLIYRFHLRADARWSNGDSVQAADFVKAFQRVAAPDSQSPYGFLLSSVENFTQVAEGSLSIEKLGISAIDDRTVEIRLANPNSHFLSVLAMPISFPVYGENPTPSRFVDPAKFVGNGAYVLADRKIGEKIRLKRNENYWNKDSVEIDEVEYFPILNASTELNMYRADELDITGTVPTGSFAALKTDFPNELRIASALALYYLAFDLTEPPLDMRALRQALSMAIDREQLVQVIGRGEQPAYGIVPPGVGKHIGADYRWRSLNTVEREQQARDLYEDAGYGAGNPLSLKLTYDAGDIHETVALAVGGMWKKVLGIDVELDKKEWKLFLAGRDDRSSWQVMRFSWFGDYNDASTFTDIFRSDSEQNLPRFSNERYDELLDQASTQTDFDTRNSLLTQAENLLIRDYPVIPLYFYVSKHLVKPSVAGFENNVLDRHPSQYLSIVEP